MATVGRDRDNMATKYLYCQGQGLTTKCFTSPSFSSGTGTIWLPSILRHHGNKFFSLSCEMATVGRDRDNMATKCFSFILLGLMKDLGAHYSVMTGIMAAKYV